MSLIDDALKRARDEASRQDEAARRTKRPWIPPEPPRRRRSAALLLAVLVGMGMAAGASWLWLRRSRVSAPKSLSAPAAALGPAPRREASPPAPLQTAVVAAPTATTPAGVGAAKPGRRKTEVPPSIPALPIRESPAVAPEKTAKTAGVPAAERTAVSGAAPTAPAAARNRGSGSFVRIATLPGGGTLELEGIVYSETHPVALIEGKVLAPGAYAGNFEVVAIEENRVQLRGRGTTFWITLQ